MANREYVASSLPHYKILQHKMAEGDITLQELHGWAAAGSVESYMCLHLSEGMDHSFYDILQCLSLKEKVSTSFRECKERTVKNELLGFPGGGTVVENLPANAGDTGLPANAGDTGSSPGLGRSHMPRSN